MKHKFIDINEIKVLSLEDSLHYMEWTASNGVELGVIAPTYTEQEIVKPYLEKLIEIFENNKGYCCCDGDSYDYVNGKESGYDNCIDAIEAMIKEMEG